MSDSVQSHRRQPTRIPCPWDSPGKNTGMGCHFLLQCMKVKSQSESLSYVRPSVTPWTAAFQAPPSMGFSRQEDWSRVPLPSPKHSLGCWNRKKIVGKIKEVRIVWTFSSVQFSRSVMSDSLQPHESKHARPPCPSPAPGVHSNSCPCVSDALS